jgi:alkylation response protein AidB-like acyl-CoA dehydrogenase
VDLQMSEEHIMLEESFSKLFQKGSTSARVRAAEPLGFDAALWSEIVAAGAPLMRVPESAGGADLGLFEAVLIAETAGTYLASAPVVEAIVAARMLALIGGNEANKWLEATGAGEKIVTLALRPAQTGIAQLVPAAAIADAIICLSDESVLLVEPDRTDRTAPNLGTIPIASLDLRASAHKVTVLGTGKSVCDLWRAGVEEWKLLAAAMLAAMGRKSLEDASLYAKERQAFDRPIGSYQGLAHPLADAVTEIDGARLLVWRAASSAADDGDAAAYLSMAYWWAIRANAVAVVKAMRVYGGYGVSMEYDAQIYFRRSRALSMLLGDPENELALLGDRLWTDRSDPTPVSGTPSISFEYGAKAEAFAASARAFFQENMNPELERFTFETEDGDHPFNLDIARAGFLFADWPSEYGGSGRTPYDMAALRTVYTEFEWPKVLSTVTHMTGKILMHFASEEAKQEILPRLATGEANIALGYSEPSCGSDIFAAKTRAVRDGDEWIIDGQKMFTSQGHLAQYALVLARTDPCLPKHAGLTLFVVPLDIPGYEAQEIKTLGGERTNITYYSEMRVADRYRIGEVNGGTKVMGAALALEQSGGDFFVGALQSMQKHALKWAKASGPDGRAPIESVRVRARLAAVQTRITVADLLDRRCLWAFAEQASQKSYGPMAKLFASEALVTCTTELAELTAPWSLLQGHNDLGAIELESRKAVQATIYGGTSEVQRSIIAESALGLPRTRS